MKRVKGSVKGIGKYLGKKRKLERLIDKSAEAIENIINPKHIKFDKSINKELFGDAVGILCIETYRGGLGITVHSGFGFVIVKLRNGGWSGPSAITCMGCGAGTNIGVSKSFSIMTFGSIYDIWQFQDKYNIRFCENIMASFGGVGRELEGSAGVSRHAVSALVSWSKSKGLYAGISFEGRVMKAHNKENRRFYNDKTASTETILKGEVTIPHSDSLTYIHRVLTEANLRWEDKYYDDPWYNKIKAEPSDEEEDEGFNQGYYGLPMKKPKG